MSILAAPAAAASRQTVCTVTVNSADEREVFRKWLPADKFDFVELVEHGREDWLARACRRGVRCDILVVSGHFAGSEFYSSRPETRETLPVDEIERAQCGASCSGLFANVREAYLFGCDTLKPVPTTTYGEASRDRMRRLFAGVPLLYGFASLAPYGRVSGPMLERYFAEGGVPEVGRGLPSASLLRLFGPSSMVAERGMMPNDDDAALRAESCISYDERVGTAERVAYWHGVFRRPALDVRRAFDRAERFVASLGEGERGDAAVARSLAALAADREVAASFTQLERDTADPALRLRMIAFARAVGWLDAPAERLEQAGAMRALLASGAIGPGEVELACSLNRGGAIQQAVGRLPAVDGPARVAALAARACLGEVEARPQVVKGLAQAADEDVQAALAYLRHHPVQDVAELRGVARAIASMAAAPAQARALEGLARLHVADREVLQDMLEIYAATRSPAVQRAIAEVLLRADRSSLEPAGLAAVLARHRLRGPETALVDELLRAQSAGSMRPDSTQTKRPDPS